MTTATVTGTIGAIQIGPSLDYRYADALVATARRQLQAGTRHLILDFEATRFIDSRGFGALLGLHRTAREAGREVVLAHLTRPVAFLVRLTNIDRVIRVFPSSEEAVIALLEHAYHDGPTAIA